MLTVDQIETISQLREILEHKGIQAFLKELNARVPHRFTGIYRFDDPVLRNVRLFDRENQHLELGTDIPLREAYCSIVHRDRVPFVTGDTRSDSTLPEVLVAGPVIAYCGVPLGDVGALCHFDLRGRPVTADEIPIMSALTDDLLARLRADALMPI